MPLASALGHRLTTPDNWPLELGGHKYAFSGQNCSLPSIPMPVDRAGLVKVRLRPLASNNLRHDRAEFLIRHQPLF
jgi:hypothetical protein